MRHGIRFPHFPQSSWRYSDGTAAGRPANRIPESRPHDSGVVIGLRDMPSPPAKVFSKRFISHELFQRSHETRSTR
jgi:hypothetical protein